MFRLGLLLAFTSRAHTPITPYDFGFDTFAEVPLSLLGLWLAAVLPLKRLFARLLDLVGTCVLGTPSPLSVLRIEVGLVFPSVAREVVSRGVS